MTIDLHIGNCLDVMRGMADCSVDAVISDPPYGLSFMGKKWDYDVPTVEMWAECLRVLKPGGHLLAFAGTRTQHRMAVRIEDAGFEIRDVVAWMYGSGFPKSLDVSKAIDKAAGAEREITGIAHRPEGRAFAEGASGFAKGDVLLRDRAATAAAAAWAGWGTALKPAFEPVTLARKPLERGMTVADNVLTHGTGGLNIDGCRVGDEGGTKRSGQAPYAESGWRTGHDVVSLDAGRWPANILHDGSPEVVDCFPNDSQRFFYCAKVSSAERGESNKHPTVKPIAVMEWLVKLVTPEGATVLDPFMGSGTTGVACKNLGRNFIGIELDENYFQIAQKRINPEEEIATW